MVHERMKAHLRREENKMKKVLLTLLCLALPLAAMAQERTGNITGTVVDPDGSVLPGVTVTLSGTTIAPIQAITSGEGRFRFLSLFPGKDYQIKMELQGFKTGVQTGIIVNINATADLKLVMEIGKLEEQVTVVAQTPVVQAKKTQVQSNINYEMLQSLPSARDPWVMLQLTPSIFIDRENVGGTESGQQSSFQSKGSTTQEWTVDGMQITDRLSGGSPGYFDFDAFEEMQVSTGMLDVEHRDPGIVINLVSRRGGNKTSLGGRFFYTDEKFQSTIGPERLAELGVGGYNRAVDLKDFGFNAGGPVIKDKIWWWAAYGIQQIQTLNLVNKRDDTYLNNYTAKVNFQLIPENRAELFFQAGDKKKFGRSSSESFPEGWNQGSKFHFGNPTWKFQDEHMFGDNLFLSVRVGASDAGFGMSPANDLDLKKATFYNSTSGVWTNSQTYFYSTRPHPYAVLQAQYFADNLFGTGTAHEVKLGVEVNNTYRTYVGGYPGNMYFTTNYASAIGDWNGDNKRDILPSMKRVRIQSNDMMYDDGTKRYAVYLSDNVTFGRFNINLGLRYDYTLPFLNERSTASLFDANTPFVDERQQNYAAVVNQYWDAQTADLIRTLMPLKTHPYVESGKPSQVISPRIGINYDVFGTGKTILKAAYSLYQGTGLGYGFWSQYGMYPWMTFYWDDTLKGNNNGKIDFNELYWRNMSVTARTLYPVFDADGNFVGNYDSEAGNHWDGWTLGKVLDNPEARVDADNWKQGQTHEAFVSVEHEIFQDFGASLSFSWKRMGRFSWDRDYYPLDVYPTLNDHIRTKDDYVVGGYVPATLINPANGQTYDPGDAAGRPWYVREYREDTLFTPYTIRTNMGSDRYQIYWGFDLVLNKRLSNKWMMNGSFTYQSQRNYYGESYTDPTNQWVLEGQMYGISMGGSSGKAGRDSFSRWMFKLTGLYQLPFDINVSGTLSAHEGYFYYTYFGIEDWDIIHPDSFGTEMPTAAYDNRTRLDDVWTINLKLEKAFKLGDTSRMYFSIDLFNVMNLDTIMRKYDINLGTFIYEDDACTSRTAPTSTGRGSGRINEIMNPFVFRLGMRFQI